MAVADRFGIGTARTIIKQVREAIAAWPNFARAARVSEVETNRISQYHSLIPS